MCEETVILFSCFIAFQLCLFAAVIAGYICGKYINIGDDD